MSGGSGGAWGGGPPERRWRVGWRTAVLASALSFAASAVAANPIGDPAQAGSPPPANVPTQRGSVASGTVPQRSGPAASADGSGQRGAADSAGADCPPSAGPMLPRGALPRATRALRDQRALRIVALGSSSTAGAGASSVGTTYPSRLALELLRRLPGHRVEVINAGINGQEAPDMLARLQRDVFDRHPDLLIWQAGSNALLRWVPVDVVERALIDGIRRSHEHGVDVLLMDLQFAPRVNDMPERDRMLAMFGRVAMATGAPVFARFDLMRGWSQALGSRFPQMLLDDGLHLNDRSYECLARRLAQVLVDATRPARGAGDGLARSR